MKPPRPKYLIKDSLTEQQENYAVLHVNWNWGLPYIILWKKVFALNCIYTNYIEISIAIYMYVMINLLIWALHGKGVGSYTKMDKQ